MLKAERLIIAREARRRPRAVDCPASMSGEDSTRAAASAFAPGSIGNVGPGFDVLGLAIDGIGDTVTVELATAGASRVGEVTGRDAGEIPRHATANCAAIAACEYLRRQGIAIEVVVSIDKGLPLSGGLGGSAASSVAGAYAAHLLVEVLEREDLIAQQPEILCPSTASDVLAANLLAAALAGETAVAGPHLDNIGPSLFGGLVLARSVDPIDVVPLPVGAPWWLALWTPRVRVRTREARAILPPQCDRETWVRQMATRRRWCTPSPAATASCRPRARRPLRRARRRR